MNFELDGSDRCKATVTAKIDWMRGRKCGESLFGIDFL